MYVCGWEWGASAWVEVVTCSTCVVISVRDLVSAPEPSDLSVYVYRGAVLNFTRHFE